MVYGHTIKRNGVLYRAGENVPDSKEKSNVAVSDITEEQKEPNKRGRKPKVEE